MTEMSKTKPASHLSLKGYIVGFGLSLGLTVLAFLFVTNHISTQHAQFSHNFLIIVLAVLAFSQFIVQMVFFLHLGTEKRPRWKLMMFGFMVLVVLILVVGSIWIMQNLNYNMMDMGVDETKVYMKENEGF